MKDSNLQDYFSYRRPIFNLRIFFEVREVGPENGAHTTTLQQGHYVQNYTIVEPRIVIYEVFIENEPACVRKGEQGEGGDYNAHFFSEQWLWRSVSK